MLLREYLFDWKLLEETIQEYLQLNYEEVQVPWIVSSEASMITCPNKDGAFITTRDEHMVGSAEQGFIQLMMDKSPKIKDETYYFSISPCFRRDVEDQTHSQWFMKLELFYKIKNSDPEKILDIMSRHAYKVMERLLSNYHWSCFPFDYKNHTASSFDIEADGMELGSYGYRSFEHNDETNTWVYGTGLALPRFQLMINNKLNNRKNLMNTIPELVPFKLDYKL